MDVSVLPNRPDLYSLENVAKEVACILSRPYKGEEYPTYKDEPTQLKIGSDTSDCPLFVGKVYRNVVTKPSPVWVSSLLAACGIRSINNIVDIGNLVMLYTGQPLNMYDADKVKGNHLYATSSYEGKFVAMDGNTYDLVKGDLLIMDDEKPACLAGIMTSDACRVDENSKNIIVEAAYFKGAAIRHTSNRLGLSSDSSLRFCKGINPDQSEHVFALVSYLLHELADSPIQEEASRYDTFKHEQKVVKTDVNYINSRLGTHFSKDEIVGALSRAYFEISGEKEEIIAKVPSFRIDIDGKADLSEEVIRILGYENVVSVLMEGRTEPQGLTEVQQKIRAVRCFLRGRGVSEALTYTLIPEKWVHKCAYLYNGEAMKLLNPITVERSYLRTNLLPSLLDTIEYNASHQEKDLAFFELSDVTYPGNNVHKRLAIALTGNKMDQGRLGETPYDFYDLKGLIEGIFSLLGIQPNRYKVMPFDLGGEEFHPYRSAKIMMGNLMLGVFGDIHPTLAKELGIKNGVMGEFNLSAIFDMKVGAKKASIPPRFPSVKRDFALVLPKKITFADVQREVARADSLIKSVVVFDLYQGEHLPEDKKSMAISLSLLSEDHTLKEEEIKAATDKAINAVKAKFGAEVRQ